MTDPLRAIDAAQTWGWQGWFAAAAFSLGTTIVFAARYLVRKQEEVWGSWMKSQSDKDDILKDIVKDSRETNRNMIHIVEKNNILIERSNEVILTALATINHNAHAIVAGLCLLTTGCTTVTQTARSEDRATNGTVVIRETVNRAKLSPFGKQDSIIKELKISAGKTATVGAGSLETSSTNSDLGSSISHLLELLKLLSAK